jgi:hypothetical protein
MASVGADFVWRMEDVLDLYAEPYAADRPVVCFDELPFQLLADKRAPRPAAPGRPARIDYEYRRQGTANLFLCFEPLAGWRHVAVTPQRTNKDFAEQMRALVDEHYPKAPVIAVVLDNLSTHSPAALYQTFPPAEARRLVTRLEFHYTPKTWELAQHGGTGVRYPHSPVSAPPPSGSEDPARGNRCLGGRTQQGESHGALALHDRSGPHQAAAPLSRMITVAWD